MSFGIFEIGLVAVLVFLLFTKNRLPELGRGFRGMITNFKKSIDGTEDLDVTDESEKARLRQPADKN